MALDEIKGRWHIIEEWGNNDYIITESGNVYSMKYSDLRKMSIKGVNNPKRYLSITLSQNNINKDFQIHRLVGHYFVEGYSENLEIDHKDKDKHNNHYTNLEWVTHQENIHRSYSTLGKVRNYKLWRIIDENGNQSNILKGHHEIEEYIQNNNLDIKVSMLEKHKQHNGYKLIEECA